MGIITFTNGDSTSSFRRSHGIFKCSFGNNVNGGSIQIDADGTVSATAEDPGYIHNWIDISGKTVDISVGPVSFQGDGAIINPEWNADYQKTIYRMINQAGWINRGLVAGKKVKADTGFMYLYGESCVFNPEGRPNMDSRTNWTAPAFVAPENMSVTDDDSVPWMATHWSIISMINYCLNESLGGGGGTPTLAGSTTGTVNLCPSDVSVGGNLRAAINTILGHCGATSVVDPTNGDLYIISLRPTGGGRTIELPHEYKEADQYTGAVTNQGNLSFDYGSGNVTHVYGAGATKVFEGTISLTKGWDPDLESAATSTFTHSDLPHPVVRMASISQNTSFQTYKDVGRRFVANDAGYWNKHFANYPGTGYDWGTIVDGGRWYVRRRPLMDRRLKRSPITGEGLPPILEYRYSTSPYAQGSFWANDWTEFKGDYQILPDEAGIYISGSMDYMWHPTYGFPDMRITTAVSGDEALLPYDAITSIYSKFDKSVWITGLGQFRYEAITVSAHDDPEVLRDDQNRLADYIDGMTDKYVLNPVISGSITIPWIDPGWMPGDWVTNITGLTMPGPAMVTTVRYEFNQAGFRTILTLGVP